MTGSGTMPTRRAAAILFWIWVVAMLGLYVGSFGPVLRLLLSAVAR